MALSALALFALSCSFDARVDLEAGEIPAPGQGPDAGSSEPDPDPDPGLTPPCGNGSVQDGESCDDGNLEGGDGCSPSCSIEPGYACGNEGCNEVEEIEVGEPYEPVGLTFGLGQVEIADCPQGFLVGFAGEVSDALGLVGVRGVCADIGVDDDGTIDWEESSMTPLLGSQSASLVASVCERDQLLIGMKIDYAAIAIEGVSPVCASASIVGGALQLGAPVVGERIGRAGLDAAETPCPAGQVAANRIAADVDPTGFGALGMRCGAPELITE